MNQDLFFSIIIGTVFLYGLGLGIPLLLRFVIYKKQFTKKRSIIILVVWWFILFMVIYILKDGGRPNPLALFIVMLISYAILRKKETN